VWKPSVGLKAKYLSPGKRICEVAAPGAPAKKAKQLTTRDKIMTALGHLPGPRPTCWLNKMRKGFPFAWNESTDLCVWANLSGFPVFSVDIKVKNASVKNASFEFGVKEFGGAFRPDSNDCTRINYKLEKLYTGKDLYDDDVEGLVAIGQSDNDGVFVHVFAVTDFEDCIRW